MRSRYSTDQHSKGGGFNEFVQVRGAREHNLTNIDVRVPRNALVVFTGVSGSGKSSLAFGTLYAEAQRRYLESVAPYPSRSLEGNQKLHRVLSRPGSGRLTEPTRRAQRLAAMHPFWAAAAILEQHALHTSLSCTMIQAVIFDVDGTLVDSNNFHVKAWQVAFHQFGKDIAAGEIHHQIGKGGDELMPVFLNEEELQIKGAAIEEFRADLFKQEYLPRVQPFPKVSALFRRITADGKRIVLGSSGKSDELEIYKKRAGIEQLVSGMTTSDDSEKSKPHPDIFEAALKILDGIPPYELLVVGDSPYDVQAAAKAGLKTIGVLCGGFAEDELRKAGAIAIYRDPADIFNRYDSSPIAAVGCPKASG
jgi:HAD superfamily hydrolase (TIGR01549 family)